MRAAFKAVGAVLAVLVLAVAALLAAFEWTWVEHWLERRVTQQTGRTLHIENLSGELSLTPLLRFTDVTLANAEWADDPHLLRIEQLETRLHLWDLLRGRLHLSDTFAKDPSLYLQRNRRGEWNLPGGRGDGDMGLHVGLTMYGGFVAVQRSGIRTIITPFRFAANVANARGEWEVRDARFEGAENRFSFAATVKTGTRPLQVDASVDAQQLRLGGFTPPAPPEKGAVPDVSFYPDVIRGIEGKVRVRVERFAAGALSAKDLNAEARFTGDRLEGPLSGEVLGGRFDSQIRVDASQEPVLSEIRVDGERLNLGELARATELPPKAVGPFGVRAVLNGTGGGLNRFLDTADGHAGFVMHEGQVSPLLAQLAELDIGEVLLEDPVTGGNLRCAVADFDVDEGVAKLNLLVIDLDETKIIGSGTIDLGKAALNLALQSRAKDFSLLSGRAPVQIKGPFSDIEVKFDVGSAVFSFLTPVELGLEEDADCNALIRWVRRERG